MKLMLKLRQFSFILKPNSFQKKKNRKWLMTENKHKGAIIMLHFYLYVLVFSIPQQGYYCEPKSQTSVLPVTHDPVVTLRPQIH